MNAAHHQLDFTFSGDSRVEANASSPEAKVLFADPAAFAPSEFEWSDDQIVHFVEKFVISSLKTLGSGYAGRTVKEEVKQWLLSDDTENPLSFVNCCSLLGYDKDELRSRVLLSVRDM